MIQLVLADPFPAMLDGLTHVFAAEPDFQVQARVSDGETALQALREHRPDILVFDIPLPLKDGLALIHEMRTEGLETRPVLFTSAPPGQIVEAVRLGVPGIVTKDKPPEALVRCIREVHAGRRWLDQGAAERAVAVLLTQEAQRNGWEAALTPRERSVARLVGEGLPNKRIASRLTITEGTAKMHLHSIYRKLHIRGRMELMRHLQDNGM
jgi:two-component system nitrate/nitrite response regulator NarL